jgi:hypothetical protein
VRLTHRCSMLDQRPIRKGANRRALRADRNRVRPTLAVPVLLRVRISRSEYQPAVDIRSRLACGQVVLPLDGGGRSPNFAWACHVACHVVV